ncbi:MAG: class I SAM-dependent methyltransferase [Candidatus Omnitrophota bacterium]
MIKRFYEKYWAHETVDSRAHASKTPQWTKENLEIIFRAASNFFKGGRLLDVGCGDGEFLKNLKQRFTARACGVDISETALKIAQSSNYDSGFISGEITDLPFKDNTFDFITIVEVAEHIIDTYSLFKELFRVLRPHGRLLVTTSDFNFLKKIIIAGLFFDKYFYPTGPHIRFFTHKTLKNLMERCGLKEISYSWNGSYLGIMPRGQILIAEK